MLMNKERNLKLQLMWQIKDKVIDIILVLIEIILDGLSKSLIQVKWQGILLEYSIEDTDPLLQLGISLIIVAQDR